MAICCLPSSSSIVWRAESSTGARSLRSICNARSSPNTFGNANSAAISITSATSTYFQRGKSSIRSTRWRSGALERALGHQLRDLGLLYLDAHAVGDLQRDEGVVDVGNAPENTAAGDHLVAGGQPREHGLLVLHPLLLRANQEEIKHPDEDHQDDDLADPAAAQGAAGALRVRIADQ